MILLKNGEVVDFLTWPPTDFSAFKNVHANTIFKNWLHVTVDDVTVTFW